MILSKEVIFMRLKEARKAANLTQVQVAKYIGINQNTYSYWENGKTKIDSESLQKLASLYSVSVDYLLGNDEAPNMPNKITLSQSFSPEEETLIKKYRQLDADGKKEIENMIDFKLQLQNEKSKDTQHKVG